ncbi:hypothetical protein PAXRUDRAFT_13199 [Paxillus rubicundulus Ve08.2h10]|uniref:Uncharacterized protein n=1 Tax=Paxillus rubicundulus Ve08.2h10 TaxID=930991 RepID=A0A0D0DM03_9AGAM|nr:hypothetical protein PAXRUDRAFT_13199 [Paxillus rubicundulus Ve08.2h10]
MNRRMEHIASVSRSSGLEKDGDSLKDRAVQEEYRAFIDEKLKTFWDLYMADSSKLLTDSAMRQKRDSQENISILFRKLREGLFSSGRRDSFALEVYETSLYLSVIFDSPVRTTSILSHLVPDIYPKATSPQPSSLTTMFVLLLHHLVTSYPSQRTYFEQIRQITPKHPERPSAGYSWISALAQSLRAQNFVRFEQLSHPDAFDHLLPPLRSRSSSKCIGTFPNLPREAVYALISRLRSKTRDRAWIVVRNAYRELSSSDETRSWLGRRLFFDSFGSETTVVRFDEWIQERCREGHLRPREGVKDRWLVCKARPG